MDTFLIFDVQDNTGKYLNLSHIFHNLSLLSKNFVRISIIGNNRANFKFSLRFYSIAPIIRSYPIKFRFRFYKTEDRVNKLE